MSTQRIPGSRPARPDDNPWVVSTRELARRPGTQRTVTRTVPAPTGDEAIGLVGVIAVPDGSDVDLDVSLESVTEGVYVSGSVSARLEGECSRCLDPLSDDVMVRFGELFAYPDSVTEETTDADEIPRLLDERVDLTQTVRDALVTDLPMAPLCRPDCPGLCEGCGERWADLAPDHGHETLDPRWAALRERLPSTE
ncbi:YceD family protein [Pseudonocardia sp. NPDC049635]|uniref:YceD family protein n=1 Tax=Pseudonocardia sp. NPDC049635 TaxID=3155506 RepID=UPI00340F802C